MSADDSKPRAAAPAESTPPAVGRGELFITVFVTGAAVMTIEMVGTRLIGPVFGVGLFVWSALLAVTLASLAGGYYAGGVLADRRLGPQLLSKAVVSAGLALLLAPLLHRWALGVAEGMGMRVGPLFAATLLFAPSLVSLGAAGPVSVKLATRSLAGAGRGVGGVYAVSTAGSLLGTLLVGFVLIPALDATAILSWTAALLILLGGASLARRKQALSLGLLLLPLFIGEGSEAQLPPGLSLLAKSQSLLGLVEVIRDENRGVRFLRSDHSVLGAAYENGGSSAFAFVEILAAVRFLQPEAKSCLNIGLGTGAVPSMLGRNRIEVDVVEIDPAVVELTKKYFDFTPTGHVYVEDARALVQRTQRRYDLIVHDTFTGGTTPEHLLSVEVLERVRSILRPGGVFALNFAGFYGGAEAEATYAVARTVRAVFPHVRAYRDSAPEHSGPVGNVVFFASLSPLEFKILPNARFDTERMEQFVKGVAAWPILEQVPPGPLVTDARNPLARLQLPIAEKHFAAMNEMLPAAVWLN
jgi:spermidine synthase